MMSNNVTSWNSPTFGSEVMEKFRAVPWFSVLTDHCDRAILLFLLRGTVT
jgi:hypothetical protein